MSGWITTIGAPTGHRIRFLYGSGDPSDDNAPRTVECECGWKLTYRGADRTAALIAHARHAHGVSKEMLFEGITIAARDALAVMEHAADDDAQRFDDVPHPSEGEP